MKETCITLCIIVLLLCITCAALFTGSENYHSASKQNMYNTHFHSINLPLVKFEKGFLNYTFYVENSWEKNTSKLSFEVNYYLGTVTFNNVVAWNEVIQSLRVEKPKLLTNKYNLFELDHGYFYGFNYDFLSYRLLEEPMDRKLIILKSDAVVKINL